MSRAHSQILYTTGEPEIEGDDTLEFRLLYEGKLQASSNRPNAEEKHRLRRYFHPQLRQLWKTTPALRTMARMGLPADFPVPKNFTPEDLEQAGINSIGKNWHHVGFNLVPLVTPEPIERCSLDILLLRPEIILPGTEEKPHRVVAGGDLDNRFKTIFDALKIPEQSGDTGHMLPQEDEDPLFCLLSDDKLISEVRLSAEPLLLLPGHREVTVNDVHLMVTVKLKPRHQSQYGWAFA